MYVRPVHTVHMYIDTQTWTQTQADTHTQRHTCTLLNDKIRDKKIR